MILLFFDCYFSVVDLYIMKYLDFFIEKIKSNVKIRRVYFKDRRVNIVQDKVKKYCMLILDKIVFEFLIYEDIIKYNIVIVILFIFLLLVELGFQDYFIYIFVDEAVQILEVEVIMFLILVSKNICVVLVGDY